MENNMVVRTVGFENKTLKNSKERRDFVPVFNNTDLTEGGESVIRKAALPFRSYSTLSKSQLSVYEADKTYPKGVMIKSPADTVCVSLADGNVGNSLDDTAWWKELSGYGGYEPGGIGLEGAFNSGLGLASGMDCCVSQAGGVAIGVMSRAGEEQDVKNINVLESGIIDYILLGDHTDKLTDTYRLVVLSNSGPGPVNTEYCIDPEDIVSIAYDAVEDYTHILFAADTDVPISVEEVDISVLNNVAQTMDDLMGGGTFNAGCSALGVACNAKGGGALASGIFCGARYDASQAFGLNAFNVCANSLSHSGGYDRHYPAASHMVKLYCVTATQEGGGMQLVDWTTAFGSVVYNGYLGLGVSGWRSVAAKITMNIMAVTRESGLILSEKHVFTFMLTQATGGIVAPLNHVSGFDEDYNADPYSEVVNIAYDLDTSALMIHVRHSMSLGAEAHWMADLDIKYMGMPVDEHVGN
jgi:hypothetical protein